MSLLCVCVCLLNIVCQQWCVVLCVEYKMTRVRLFLKIAIFWVRNVTFLSQLHPGTKKLSYRAEILTSTSSEIDLNVVKITAFSLDSLGPGDPLNIFGPMIFSQILVPNLISFGKNCSG